jgi:intracellular sulfur oxidation DsrE/DsrF family protein
MKKRCIALALGLSCALPLHAQTSTELLVTVNSGHPQTQGMALTLASRAVFGEKIAVRVLLCSEGGKLAIKGMKPVAPLKPLNLTPNDMLQDLMKGGARVEVCGLFLPNSEWKTADLIEGITVANPGEVAAHLLKPQVKALTY